MAEITKDDIIAIVPQFTKNIEDRLINPHIVDAFENYESSMPAALLNAIKELNISDDPQTKPDLFVFYQRHFKKCWVWRMYSEFLTFHGKNVTAFGIAYTTDINSTLVAPEEIGYMIRAVDRKASIAETKMMNELQSRSFTFDSINYSPAATEDLARPRKKFGIRSIG